jgi:hypothetical protein
MATGSRPSPSPVTSAMEQIPAVRLPMSALPPRFVCFTLSSRRGGRMAWKAEPDPKLPSATSRASPSRPIVPVD